MILVTTGILLSVILIIAAFSGMFSEKSGTVNIGINGMMISGGLIYWMVDKSFHLTGSLQIVGYLIAVLGGMITGILFAFAAITLKANQVIVGTAINLLMGGIALFIWKYKGGTIEASVFDKPLRFSESTTSDFSYIFGAVLIIGIIVIIISWLWISYTPWGLRLKAAGENPQALDSQGISVVKTRYYGMLISGALAGLAGAMYVTIQGQFNGNVSGLGFIALAILIAGQWNPVFIVLTGLVFGMVYSFGLYITTYQVSWAGVADLIRVIPFALALITLVLTSKNSRAPAAAGIAYDKSKR